MKLWIDLQGAQTESRFRGIGRYTVSFVRALAAAAGQHHEIGFVVNSALWDHSQALVSELSAGTGRRPSRSSIPVAASRSRIRQRPRAHVAERVREAFIGDLRPDVVLCRAWWRAGSTTRSRRSARSSLRCRRPRRSTMPFRCCAVTISRQRAITGATTCARWNSCGRAEPAARDLRARAQGGRRSARCRRKHGSWRSDAASIRVFTCVGRRHARRRARALRGRPPVCSLRRRLRRPQERRRPGRGVRQSPGHVASQPCTGLRRPHRRRRIADDSCGAASEASLDDRDVLFTGPLTDRDLVDLYRGADLFVFPSVHEGFGLPVAEAMACGTPSRVGHDEHSGGRGRADALFDPLDTSSIAALMEKGTLRSAFRRSLSDHGRDRSRNFTWEACAAKAWPAFEALHEAIVPSGSGRSRRPVARPRLAFVSPLPPDRTGIADYSAGLIGALRRYYEVAVVTEQSRPLRTGNVAVHSLEWFDAARRRIRPGALSRRQFAVSRADARRACAPPGYGRVARLLHDGPPGLARGARRRCDGDAPPAVRFARLRGVLADHVNGRAHAQQRYPANSELLRRAAGVIVHSAHVVELATRWYGAQAATRNGGRAELCRQTAVDRPSGARATFGVPDDAFVVCSFGFLGAHEAERPAARAWEQSGLARIRSAWLVFVGENEGGEYGRIIERAIRAMGPAGRVRITGFVDEATFDRYLAAADVGGPAAHHVARRDLGGDRPCARGRLTTIVNAHGTAADYPDGVVYRLADDFDDAALAARCARCATTRTCARRIARLADRVHRGASRAAAVARAISRRDRALGRPARAVVSGGSWARLRAASAAVRPRRCRPHASATAIAGHRPVIGARQLLVDVTVVARTDLRTGIERVVRGVLNEWLRNPPQAFGSSRSATMDRPLCLRSAVRAACAGPAADRAGRARRGAARRCIPGPRLVRRRHSAAWRRC